MNYLEPIYKNNAGTAYALKSYGEENLNNIQLQIGDFALLMRSDEMPSFLKVIKSAKSGCVCKDCLNNNSYRTIKCETTYASIKLKANQKLIDDLEELVLSVICNSQVEKILNDNNIE